MMCAALGRGQRLNALALDFRGLQHGRDQLALAAQNFRILHLDFVLFLHCRTLASSATHLLLHDVGLDVVGFVGLRLLLLDGFQVLRLLDFEIALLRPAWPARAFPPARVPDRPAPWPRRLLATPPPAGWPCRAPLRRSATSASRLMRATSGRPMLVMYSFLSRTSLMVNEITSRPILFMSSAQVARIRSPTISGSFTICFHRELADDAAQMAFHDQPDQAFALAGRTWSETAPPRSGSTPDPTSL
jgi:hypothetical protein